jgi:hypothetical protein
VYTRNVNIKLNLKEISCDDWMEFIWLRTGTTAVWQKPRKDDPGSRVRFLAGAGNFSQHRVQNGSGADPASYPMGTRGSFLGGKAAGA